MIKDTRFLAIEDKEPVEEMDEFPCDEEMLEALTEKKVNGKKGVRIQLYIAS